MNHAHVYPHFWPTLVPRTSSRFATQEWPARSPDLTPLDYSMWRTMKGMV